MEALAKPMDPDVAHGRSPGLDDTKAPDGKTGCPNMHGYERSMALGHEHHPRPWSYARAWWKYSPWISTQILHAIGAQTET